MQHDCSLFRQLLRKTGLFMLAFLPPVVRGILATLFLILNTVFFCIPLFLTALIKACIPIEIIRLACNQVLNLVVTLWIYINTGLITLFTPMKVVVTGDTDLRKDRSYLITSNHQTWADIVIVQQVLNGKAPSIKFFLKKELIWVPILGLCWWALDFPFMKRYSREFLEKHPEKKGEDLETTRKACEKFQGLPVSVYNYVEGTRFTEAKHKHQQSPFKHLLKPKAGGIGFVLGAMGNNLQDFLNITLSYKGKTPDFWDFLCGRCPEVKVHIEKSSIPDKYLGRDYLRDDDYRKDIQSWVNKLWEEKDRRLEEMES
ncbi:acyltransferase [Sansalvadorimonas sp. 2012CJ34-2]|uniref:Acyltransferase n=1 Tax=Parendozoicomonas callyspongiae TaxID=2942213 RepID=A0ABT0PDZ7_9GAMM|nr:acyltransferase [Sansalvadorimonas sp. 2012CJ34-2]MCL6269496.1 acyltransferase [Sansalvadorimonas sp. 2012CJ34-2]